MSNIHKPRYKICYQLKNKIWINKNSKINSFYNLRASHTSKVFPKRRLKNMKWIIVKRFLIPRQRNKIHGRFIYKNMFQQKQQLKKFYGYLKEYQLQYIFKKKWKQQKTFKQNVFASILEKRLDMILYRMKILPTIFSCHQFISHQGVLINGNIVKTINYSINHGDIISFNEKHWALIYERIEHKLIQRSSGHKLLKNYYYKTFLNQRKKKNIFKNKFKLSYQIRKLKFKYNFLLKNIKNLEKNQIINLNKNELNFIINNKIIKLERLINLFQLINKIKLTEIDYKKFEKKLILLLISLRKDINKLNYLIKIYKIINNNNNQLMISKLNYYNKLYKIKNNNLKILAQKLFLKSYFKFTGRFKNYKKDKIKNIYKIGKPIIGFYPYPHWYIPNYIEIDYNTLQISFIYEPNSNNTNEIFYPFFFSFNELITFYRNKGL